MFTALSVLLRRYCGWPANNRRGKALNICMNKSSLAVFLLFVAFNAGGQRLSADSLRLLGNPRFSVKALLVPAALVGYGVVGLESNTLKQINRETQTELHEHIDDKFTIDDFSQYSPFLSVYALDLAGVKGKNNFRDKTTVLATAYLLMGAAVDIIKTTGNEMRPDGTSKNSFPSGHTATAFMGAEFLYQEYKDISVWYGVAGYAVAAGTGFFRMYNSRHWLTDVAAGAGIGILSTKLAYWLLPFVSKHLLPGKGRHTGLIAPIFRNGNAGLEAVMTF